MSSIPKVPALFMPEPDEIDIGGTFDPEEGASEILSPKKLENTMRVQCAHGAPLLTAGKMPTNEELDAVNATGVVMTATGRRVSSFIRDAQRVVFHTFNPRRKQEYVDRGALYVRHHGEAVDTEEGVRLGGPGLVTITSLEAVGDLRTLKGKHTVGTRGSPQDRMMGMVLDQPVIVRVGGADDVLTPEVKEQVLTHEIEGFIFQDVKDLLQFQSAWKEVALPSTIDASRVVHPEPSVLLEASPEDLLQFFANEQNFAEGNPCDGYIVTEPLSPSDAQRIWDARVTRIADVHDKPLEFPEGALRVGVLNLQGASKVERWMLKQLRQQILTWMNIRIKMVHTRQEIENLHGIVYPGGWHGPQLMLYNDHRLGINEAVRQAITEERLGVLFSCAGAIGAGNPKKERIGCSKHPPSNFLDYGIHNNKLSGRVPMRFRRGDNGSESWEERMTNCVGAPIFLNPNPEQLQPLVTTMDHAPVALKKRAIGPKPPIYAAGIHSTLLESEWLEELGRSQAEKRRKGVQD